MKLNLKEINSKEAEIIITDFNKQNVDKSESSKLNLLKKINLNQKN